MSELRRRFGATMALFVLAILPMGLAHAQVQVTSADPSSALQGTVSLDVTISGNGFDNSAQVQFLVTGTTNPGGITVKNVSVRSARKLIATIEVADTAVVNKFDIEVRLSNGRKGKGTTLFAVQAKAIDPCVAGSANWLGFPAFAYFTNIQGSGSGDPYEVRVASANGRCSVRVMTLPENALTISFAESSATPGMYRLMVGKYLFLGLVEFRVGADPLTGRPTLAGLNVVPSFRPTASQLGYSGVDLSPDGEHVAIIRYFGLDRRLTVADFDDSTPDIDVCAWTGQTDYPGDWSDVAWGPSGRITFEQSTSAFLRIVGIDGNDPQSSPTQCNAEVVISFRETEGPTPLGEPYIVHNQTVGQNGGVEYLALQVLFREAARKGTQGACEIWVWNAATQPATRVLDRTNGAPRGMEPSFKSDGSLLYRPDPTSGCNATSEIGEFGFLGAPTSIQGTSTGLRPAGLKKLTN